ncbi:TPA_asm: hypothetical protein GB034_22865 [Salmonella enterica subsp. diarizonae]|uniref:Uncharacterized protein n=1 Tax=Salmonella diarizonae TaxID=59204 RepID=A0A6X8JKF3_SALDZ|nr:hypothetical protein [Salmonella enterica subsp. diarizonae]HAB4587815.1 hypothetical protein [Salmonella enterica subsp. diarizonae]HAE1597401.1 hypothetical protein [Salmonella enterica subsp. diarizonae]
MVAKSSDHLCLQYIVYVFIIACFFVANIINTVLLLIQRITHRVQKRRKIKVNRKWKTAITIVF